MEQEQEQAERDAAIARAEKAEAERDRLAGLVKEAGEALKPFAEIVEKADERALKSGFAPSFDEYEVEWSFTFGELRTARALASRLKAEGGANG